MIGNSPLPDTSQIPTTIGMKIDSVIATIDAIPYTYQAFVIVCCVFAFLVLNSNQPTSSTTDRTMNAKNNAIKQHDGPMKNVTKRSLSSSTPSKPTDEVPQPKWHILKLLNIVSVIGLLTSFFWFASNASTYLNNDNNVLFKFMALWSTFLCYFFGFFGISFIDDDELERGSQVTTVNDNGNTTADLKKEKQIIDNDDGHVTKPVSKIHPPAASTQPICSDVNDSSSSSSFKSTKCSDNNNDNNNISSLSDVEVANLVITNKIKDHHLEKILTPHRAVQVRRLAYQSKLSSLQKNKDDNHALSDLPYQHDLDYSRVYGANCETVIGYIPLPVGIVGPLTLNDETVYFPMATTEGCLVASTNRGCKAITQGGGAHSVIMRDGITRAPCVRLQSARDAAALRIWCEEDDNFRLLKSAFEKTTSFGKLESLNVSVAGRNAYLRMRCFSGDAMGMNMVSKGSLAVIDFLKSIFPSLTLVALSGNMCTDKKAAAINWIEGRGKSVVVEATIPKDVVRSTLKTDVKTIVSVNVNKNLIGSAMAGAIGGFNAHASNIVTAVFLATGQDPAQNVESSNCITIMEETNNGDLWISCTMPSIEVGTVGGGTGLPAQGAGLKIIGCKGGGERPGDNAKKLAHVVASAVMAGELSLLSALAANTLVQAHMQHNRKSSEKK